MYYNPLQEETLYRTLVESLSQGLVIFQNNHIVFANTAEAELTGYSIKELLAMTPEQTLALAHPDDREMVARRLQELADNKPISMRAEIRLVRKDGSILWVDLYHTSIEYHGKPASQIVTLDVTERKQMEAAVVETEMRRQALDQERELKELKSRFISMVSHQFRTPMSVISTTGYLLENYNDKLPPEKRQEYFGKIRSQIDRLDKLIENILTISQNEEKGMAFAPTTIDLEAYCRDMVAEMQLTSPTLHQMVFTVDGDLATAFADEKLLHNILTNLLSNAIKYSPDGGEVIVNLARQGDEAVFEISDSGIGISDDDQKHLFEPFHRGQNVSGIKGNGLGLKIAKDFVDVHGGTIAYVSEIGKGTTFTVRLPIVQREMQAEIQGVDDPTRSSGGA
jgi:PAS domain S-box-containing protein